MSAEKLPGSSDGQLLLKSSSVVLKRLLQPRPASTFGETSQLFLVSDEVVGVASVFIDGIVLPDGVVRPFTKDFADSGAPSSENQGVLFIKGGAVTGASLPPIRRGVDHRIAIGQVVVGVGEVLDPAHHFLGGEAKALWLVGGLFEVEHTGQGAPVSSPAAAVLDEELSLGGS